MLSFVLFLCFIQASAAISNCDSSCSSQCVAVPGNSAWATSAHCQKCKTGYQYWPCDIDGACQCNGESASTAAPITSESSVTRDQSTPSADCDSNCSECEAVPGNNQQATDARCAPCANGQAWWPCNQEGLCQCKNRGATTGAPIYTTGSPMTTMPTATTTRAAPVTSAAPVTTAAPVTSGFDDSELCDPSAQSCNGDCTAVPNNAAWATDSHCAQCATGYEYWPCDVAGACQCSGSSTGAPGPNPTTGAPSPDTTQSPNPSTAAPIPDGDVIKGYYMWSWKGVSSGPADTNAGTYFSGWNSVSQALSEMPSGTIDALKGTKYFTIGGGNDNGVLTASNVQQFVNDLTQVQTAGFTGIMWDIEKVQGSADSMNPVFANAFAAVKAAGMMNAITVSHTAPYDTDTPQDATDFVDAFVKDANVDIISPQLYTSGNESQPDFAVTGNCASAGCGWDLYRNMRSGMRLAPSIANESQYDAAKTHLQNNEQLDCSGYFVWQQSNRRLDANIIV